jgi:hypothetical protein
MGYRYLGGSCLFLCFVVIFKHDDLYENREQ